MVHLSDGMSIRLFDIELEPGSAFTVQDLMPEEKYTVALFGCSGSMSASITSQALELLPDKLIGFSSNTDCVISATPYGRLLLVACMGASYEGILHRSLAEIEDTERSVAWGNGLSQRYLVERDSLGFAFCYTIGNANTDSNIQYKNHLEACYYLSGSGEYIWEGGSHAILTEDRNATMFVMNQHDQHRMVIKQRSVCISVFCPPIAGDEKHDFTGHEPSAY